MSNVKLVKDKKYIKLAYKLSKAKVEADTAKKIVDDLQKELKATNADKLPMEWLTTDYTIINGFTNEIMCSQSIQNRSQYAVEEICSDLRVAALTVENGYRTPQPVACLKVGKMSSRGF